MSLAKKAEHIQIQLIWVQLILAEFFFLPFWTHCQM